MDDGGRIDYDSSSVTVSAIKYNVVHEDDADVHRAAEFALEGADQSRLDLLQHILLRDTLFPFEQIQRVKKLLVHFRMPFFSDMICFFFFQSS